MVTVRKAVLFVAILFAALVMAVFAYINPDRVPVDLGFARLENVPVSLAFVICIALGWLFGLMTAGAALLRMSSERRRLRRDLKLAEAEVKSLRSLPLHDAD